MNARAGLSEEAAAYVLHVVTELKKGGHHEQAQKILDDANEAHRIATEYGYVLSPKSK